MVTENDKNQIKELCRGAVLHDVPLKNLVSFRIGGPADIVAFPRNAEELIALVAYVQQERIPLFVLGEGTNLIVRDKGFRGVVLKLSEGFKVITIERETNENVYVTAQAGARLMRVVSFASEHSLTGIEFATGIPGSVGGAIAMNAGAFGREIKDVLHSMRVVTPRRSIDQIERDQIHFTYRSANLPSGTIILESLFELQRGTRKEIAATIQENLSKRKKRQPLDLPSAGSVFRNPPGLFAARLIEEVGLKGYQIGGAAVSHRHANFIVNRGEATAGDVLSLISLIQKRVKAEKGIDLQPEIHVIGQEQ